MNSGAKICIRALFCATLFLFALQMPLIYVLKREPYPALAMPSFAGHPNQSGVIERNEPSVEVRFADGRTKPVELLSLLPPTKVLTGHVLRAFGDDEILAEPETVEWLKYRTSALFSTEQLSGINIIWRTAYYNVHSNTDAPTMYSPQRTIRVEFDGDE